MTLQEKVLKLMKDTGLSYKKLADLFEINQTTLISWSNGRPAMPNTLKRFNHMRRMYNEGQLDEAIAFLKVPRDVAQPSHYAIYDSMEAEDEYILSQLVELIEKTGHNIYPESDDFVKYGYAKIRAQIQSKASHEYYRELLFPVTERARSAIKQPPRHKLLIGRQNALQAKIERYGDMAVIIR